MKEFSNEEWKLITGAFEYALSLDKDMRIEFLGKFNKEYPALSMKVQALINEDENIHPILQQSAVGIWQTFTNDESLIGTTIGSYRLTGLLGSGAMGSVFSAERADEQFKQTVALKLIRKELYSKNYETDFRKERQILANLQHPNIASLFDGGVTKDNRPWFSMELIEGERINEFCKNRQLSTSNKVELFLQVCSAIQFAHANLIIHLDLKPANILVNKEGLVKVLDFGVAHSFSQSSHATYDSSTNDSENYSYQFTLGYAAPEQIQGLPVNTGSDIYAAGTILYELLMGYHPFKQFLTDSAALSKAILTKDPMSVPDNDLKPHNHKYGISATIGDNDLESICRKALAKNPKDRYVSMEAMRLDIENWLHDYPVAARNGDGLYKFGKYLKRHKWQVTIASIAIVLLTATIGWYTKKVRAERDVAIKEAIKSEKVLATMLNIFSKADPGFGTGEDITAVALLKNGTAQIEEDLKDQPEVLCMLLRQMASAFNALSEYNQADTISIKAFLLSIQNFPYLHKEVADCHNLRGMVLNHLGNYDSSLYMYYKAHEIYKALKLDKEEDGIFNLYEISSIHYNLGQYVQADSVQQIVYNINNNRLTPPHKDLADDLMAMGINKRKLGEYEVADSFLQASLQMKEELYKPPHPELAYSYNFLASSKQDIGDYQSALPLAKEAYRQYQLVLDSDHPELIASQSNLARIYSHLGVYDSAAILYEKGIGSLKKKYDKNHHYINGLLTSLGNVRVKQQRYAEAEDLFLEAIESNKGLLTKGDVKEAVGYVNLGNLYLIQQQYKKAYPHLKMAYEIRMSGLPKGHDQIGASQFLLAKCLIGMKRNEEAKPLLDAAFKSLGKIPQKFAEALEEITQLSKVIASPE